jgi:hypothetical protein
MHQSRLIALFSNAWCSVLRKCRLALWPQAIKRLLPRHHPKHTLAITELRERTWPTHHISVVAKDVPVKVGNSQAVAGSARG